MLFPVWTRESNGEWYATSAFDNVVNMSFGGASARLVLIEREN